jgi:hypothetical protein
MTYDGNIHTKFRKKKKMVTWFKTEHNTVISQTNLSFKKRDKAETMKKKTGRDREETKAKTNTAK